MPWPASAEPLPNLHCGVFLKGLTAAEMALCVCSLVQRPTPKSGHSLSKSKAPILQHPAHSRRNTQWMNTHHTHTHTQATAFQLGPLLFKAAEMEAKKTHHTSFVKSPCPAPAWLSVSSVFGYLGFLPVGRGNKQGKHS